MGKQKSKIKNKRHCTSVVAIFFLVFLYCSCSIDFKPKMNVLHGSLAWTRSQWSSATLSFMETLIETENKDLQDYALLGLATVYLSQEAYNSADLRLNSISEDASKQLLSARWYQAGIASYKNNLFEEAAHNFKKSLELEPSSIDAKINYELSIQALVSVSTPKAQGPSAFEESKEKTEGMESIFEYIQKKEGEKWKSAESQEDALGVPDY